MLLVQNWPFSTLFCLGSIGQENVFSDILKRKNAFLGYKNKKFKQSKNFSFSQVFSPCFQSKIGHFSTFFSLGSIDQENMFVDILERENAFLGYKDKKFKMSRKRTFFQMGQSMLLVQNWSFFHFYLFRQYRPGKCVL